MDGDGLSDGQEINTYNTNPNLADTDGDGLSDGTEIGTGTNPLDANDPAPVISDDDGDGLINADEATYGTNPNVADTDGDGLSDGDEVHTHGTNPNVVDTDGDGINDGDEVIAGTDPLDANSPGSGGGGGGDPTDSDGDGLSDDSETNIYHTDPNDADTDNDLLSDGDEVNVQNTNPLLVDTDGDGLSDGAEVLTYFTNPLLADTDADGLNDNQEINTYNTDPGNADTDGDGINDGAEITAGTDPLDAGSPGGGSSGGGDTGSGGGGGGGGGSETTTPPVTPGSEITEINGVTVDQLLDTNPEDLLIPLEPTTVQPPQTQEQNIGEPGTETPIKQVGETTTLAPIVTTIGDFIPPSITLTKTPDAVQKGNNINIEGVITDAGGVIESLKISLDGGKSTFPATTVKGIGKSKTTFSFSSAGLVDGNYKVVVFAEDNSGNLIKSKEYDFVMDNVDPYIGSNLFVIGLLGLLPNQELVHNAAINFNETLYLPVSGGATEVIAVDEDGLKYPFSQIENTGIWMGEIGHKKDGYKNLKIISKDGGNNEKIKNIDAIYIYPEGKILDETTNKNIENYTVSVYEFLKENNSWHLWDAEVFGQQNPVQQSSGKIPSFVLPQGIYTVLVEADGYRKLFSESLSVDKTEVINLDAKLSKLSTFLNSLDFGGVQDFVKIQESVTNPYRKQFLQVGDAFPYEKAFGKTGMFKDSKENTGIKLVSVFQTWNPFGESQLNIFDKMRGQNLLNKIQIVSEIETEGKLQSFLKRGLEDIKIYYDRNGEFTDLVNVSSAPYHFFLSDDNKVIEMRVGVLSQQEIQEIFNSLNNLNK